MPHAAFMVLVLAGCAILATAALHDVGFRTVPNRVCGALLLTGLGLRVLSGTEVPGLLCGAAVFAVTYTCWRLGWMGGADVKLLTAASVFVPPPMVPTLVVATSLAGGALAVIYLLGSRIARRPGASPMPAGLLRRALRCEQWRLNRRGPLPYAAAIATGSWFTIATS